MHRLSMPLRHSGKDNRWHPYVGHRSWRSFSWRSFDRKTDGESAGRERGHLEYRLGGEATLVVHRADGSVELQYTYARPASQLQTTLVQVECPRALMPARPSLEPVAPQPVPVRRVP